MDAILGQINNSLLNPPSTWDNVQNDGGSLPPSVSDISDDDYSDLPALGLAISPVSLIHLAFCHHLKLIN